MTPLQPVKTTARGKGFHVNIEYTNHRGDRSVRRIIPRNFTFGITSFYPTPQWLLAAFDVDKQAMRVFALQNIHEWKPCLDEVPPLERSLTTEEILPTGTSIYDKGELDG